MDGWREGGGVSVEKVPLSEYKRALHVLSQV